MTISRAEARPEDPAPRERRLRYLIARRANNQLELLTLTAATPRGEALPVFDTEWAARDFLRRGGFGGAWWVRESTTGELVSLLLGLLSRVERVALDPRPGLDAEPRSKKEFIDALIG